MIDTRLKELITPYLRMELQENQWKYIDQMFSEARLSVENGQEIITLPPPVINEEDDISFQFSALNGACLGICFWSEIKKRGKKI